MTSTDQNLTVSQQPSSTLKRRLVVSRPLTGVRQAGQQKCSICKRVAEVSFSAPRQARRCLGCSARRLYCVACPGDTPDCSGPICTNPEHSTCFQRHVAKEDPEFRAEHGLIDPFPAFFVDAVMHSETDKAKIRDLHTKDKEARWFYVRERDDTDVADETQAQAEFNLMVHDRFIRLCDHQRTGGRLVENDYPAFVSFIGNTSVGKSTIVRAMLLLGALKAQGEAITPTAETIELINKTKDGKGSCMPVPRSGNFEYKTDPTTMGVQLYHDEGPCRDADGEGADRRQAETSKVDKYPLMMADCEGFQAGTATPLAARYGDAEEDEGVGIIRYPVTAECYSGNGKDGIDLFYARVLYAISDVIVYVTKSDQTIEKDLTRVLEWASAAVDKSYNQPSRKTLIIVRNKETRQFETGGSAYSNDDLEKLYLRRNKKLWEKSKVLRSFVTRHNHLVLEDRIHNNEDLYRVLFHNIKCCYIPSRGEMDASLERPRAVFKHLQELRDQIDAAVKEERRLKARGFALYDVPTTNHILTQVFEHFRASEGPLDFFRAARRDNPSPRNTEQHMANFLRIVFEHSDNEAAVRMIIDAVALMMVTYVWRESLTRKPTSPLPCSQHTSTLSAATRPSQLEPGTDAG